MKYSIFPSLTFNLATRCHFKVKHVVLFFAWVCLKTASITVPSDKDVRQQRIIFSAWFSDTFLCYNAL